MVNILVSISSLNSPLSPLTERYISPHHAILSQTALSKIIQRLLCFPSSSLFLCSFQSSSSWGPYCCYPAEDEHEQALPTYLLSTTSTDAPQVVHTYFQEQLTQKLACGFLFWSLGWSQTLM